MFQKDKEFVDQILKGKEEAWHQFVERFSDAVFYIARKWTYLDCKYADKSDMRKDINPSTGKLISWCDDTIGAYLWLLDQLRNKLETYEGRISLEDFVWSKINSPNLLTDYLRHIYGRLDVFPNIIKKEDELVQIILKLMRMNKSDEQILRILRIKYNIEMTIEKLWKIKNHILELLNKVGLKYLVIDDVNIPLGEALITASAFSSTKNYEDRMLLYLTLLECLEKLDSEEKDILDLIFRLELTAKQIVELYQLTNKKLLGRIESKDIKPNNIYSIRDNSLKKLHDCITQ